MNESPAEWQPGKSIDQLTVAQLKELRRRSAKRRLQQRTLALTPRSTGDHAPLSYSQERLWVLDQLGLVGSAYNSQMAFRLEGDLHVPALEQSIADLIRRHESLRTHFEMRDGMPMQVIDPPTRFPFRVLDLSGELGIDGHIEQVSRAEAQQPFDLAKSPLIRTALLRFSERLHVMVLTLHHIVTDGWSWAVIHREFGELYGAHVQGRAASLPPLPVQYADYAIWQRQWFQGDVLEEQLNFWREQLKGAPAELQLPFDRQRTSAPTFAGARRSFEIDASLTAELQRVGREEGVTLFMILLAAYQVLLSRYSGQKDVVIGAPIAGRTHASTEELIGFFVNTLVLRTDLSGNLTFRQLLGRVKQVTLAAYAHQDLPFEKLVMELRPDRNLTRQPIFQVALAMQNYPQEQIAAPGLTSSRIQAEHASAVFDLTLHVSEVAGGLQGMFVYAADLFNSTTIERMGEHLRVLLQAFAADPDSRIELTPVLTAAERELVLQRFNETERRYPKDKPVHVVFEECVDRAPSALAVVCEAEALTYAQLDRRANQLAHYLCEQGVLPGDFVPLVMHRLLELLIAQLAVLKIGAVYVPVDPLAPAERQAFIIRDSGARHVVVAQSTQPTLDSDPLHWIDVSGLADTLDRMSAVRPRVSLSFPAPAYVMYTSGTTGLPKGVVVPHHAINRLVLNNEYAHLLPTDCIANCSNPAFDAATFEIWGALLNGATVSIVPQSVLLDPERFAGLLRQHKVTVLWITVGLLAQYADALAPVFGGLRYVLTGGDVVDPKLVRRVLATSPPECLINAYGPTECTTFSTTQRVGKSHEQAASIPIGKPISNSKIYVLDSHLQPAPIGVPGDIYVGGDGVALGYLNRAELTAERFPADPFSAHANARMYKTGDLGKWRSDGSIDFLGRNDHQVKLRGFRVELGEIEAHLGSHGEVRDCIVITRQDGSGEKRLAAYVTLQNESTLSAADLRAHLKPLLPEYMIPSAIVILEELPLTPNGKVDRGALPDHGDDTYTSAGFEPPVGPIETALAQLWQELLSIERVGRNASFFELGGHSLLVIKMLFALNQRFASKLQASDIYKNPTVMELAQRLGAGASQDVPVDLTREASLDDAIVVMPSSRRGSPRHLLLTGCTGFVGRFLLAQLLRDTPCIVHCLVRSASDAEALSRVRGTLEQWDLWHDMFASRIVAVAGDLRLPGLGLDEGLYKTLSETIDSVYHCGTSMNHLETYQMAQPANVQSAREMLRFATTGKLKLINYVSTLSIFSAAADRAVVDETSCIDREVHFASKGYAASKWVGEKIYMMGRARGVPCNIFRLGLVWADSQQGRFDERQREHRVIKTSLMLGKGIAGYRYEWPPTPVDYVARAIAFLANKYAEGAGTFHISASKQMEEGVFERYNAGAGRSLELLSMYDWIGEVRRAHSSGTALPILPLVAFAFSMDEESFDNHRRRLRETVVRFDCARTHRELEDAGIVAPALGDELLALCAHDMFSRDPEMRQLPRRKSTAPLLPPSAIASRQA